MNTSSSIDAHAPILPPAHRWRLDPEASTAEFRVPHFWGLITVKGRFTGLDGYLELDEGGHPHRILLRIEAASLDTGISRRDHHLRGSDFFDTDAHPEVRFRSNTVSELADQRLRVAGELEAAGERVSLTLEPTLERTDEALVLKVSTTVDQRALGMTWSPLGMTRSPATVTVHATLRRRP